ncbi:hypothetical protein TSA1_26705 [Bradyrhizobium nitroreducens]|uniref:Uncharacterized protein n=1 Tax=Bradyrhizobium nitroreducens TaxID=709803 RepID=A0A2M6UH72_9BRAD|nr:hypothetical protein [Bradyrhizobium nitroreducens]PIT03960.1 hypothetical protein TSA1_26705 [Bradyrhizobium nitroreducens]
MGQKDEPSGAHQVYILGLDADAYPCGARFNILRDSIVSAAMDLSCRILIRQPPEVGAVARKLPLGYVLGTGKTVRLFIPRIGPRLYQQVLEAAQTARIHEETRLGAALSQTAH